jgi:hypothetical protein
VNSPLVSPRICSGGGAYEVGAFSKLPDVSEFSSSEGEIVVDDEEGALVDDDDEDDHHKFRELGIVTRYDLKTGGRGRCNIFERVNGEMISMGLVLELQQNIVVSNDELMVAGHACSPKVRT